MKRLLVLVLIALPALAAADPFVDTVSATVRIMGGGASGTGFLIELSEGEIVLATAAHVFADVKGEVGNVIFRRPDESGGYARLPVEVKLRDGEKPLWTKHERHDLAYLEIAIPEGAFVKPFQLKQIAEVDLAEKGDIGVGQEVCVPGYPIGTEANSAGWPVLRRGSIATHPLTPLSQAETFFVDTSSFGGESGAPVVAWKGDEVFVIGVISSMQRQTEKTKTALEEKVTHLPLGLGIAVQSPLLRELLGQAEGTSEAGGTSR